MDPIKCPECGTWWRGEEHRCEPVRVCDRQHWPDPTKPPEPIPCGYEPFRFPYTAPWESGVWVESRFNSVTVQRDPNVRVWS